MDTPQTNTNQPPVDTQDKSELFEWISPSRPFKTHSKQFYRTAISLVLLVTIILVFMGELLLIGVILSIFFVYYVLSTVAPDQIKHKVTKLGIDTGNYFHKWEEMKEFWFDESHGEKMVVVQLYMGFPTHLRLLLGDVTPEVVKKLFSPQIPFKEKPEKTFLDKASTWLSQKIPLEKTT